MELVQAAMLCQAARHRLGLKPCLRLLKLGTGHRTSDCEALHRTAYAGRGPGKQHADHIAHARRFPPVQQVLEATARRLVISVVVRGYLILPARKSSGASRASPDFLVSLAERRLDQSRDCVGCKRGVLGPGPPCNVTIACILEDQSTEPCTAQLLQVLGAAIPAAKRDCSILIRAVR